MASIVCETALRMVARRSDRSCLLAIDEAATTGLESKQQPFREHRQIVILWCLRMTEMQAVTNSPNSSQAVQALKKSRQTNVNSVNKPWLYLSDGVGPACTTSGASWVSGCS